MTLKSGRGSSYCKSEFHSWGNFQLFLLKRTHKKYTQRMFRNFAKLNCCEVKGAKNQAGTIDKSHQTKNDSSELYFILTSQKTLKVFFFFFFFFTSLFEYRDNFRHFPLIRYKLCILYTEHTSLCYIHTSIHHDY